MTELSKVFALAVPAQEAVAITDDVAFFQMVRASILKKSPENGTKPIDYNAAIKQIVSRAIVSEGRGPVSINRGRETGDLDTLREVSSSVERFPEESGGGNAEEATKR